MNKKSAEVLYKKSATYRIVKSLKSSIRDDRIQIIPKSFNPTNSSLDDNFRSNNKPVYEGNKRRYNGTAWTGQTT